MTLHIHNPEADKLAHELAARGKNVDDIVLQALRKEAENKPAERLAAREAPEDEILAIIRHCSSLPDYDTRPPDEILGYDELGLPT